MNGTIKAASPAATLRSLSHALLENGGHTPGRQTPPPPSAQARVAQADQRGALAAKDSALALLRQQLSQLTADFQFNLKLLEERDLELERMEAVMSGVRESAAAKELALAETKRLLAEKDTALREKESRVAVLEERQRQTMDLCERQVADARSSRDEEVAKCEAKCKALEQQLTQRIATVEGIADREKTDIIAGYEKQVTAALTSERESRQAVQQARQEGELARSQLQRAEAKVAEQELAMQRMVSQFEGALQTLQQLEGQYAALAAESAAAEKARSARIQQLEVEVDSLRAANAVLHEEQDTMVGGLAQQLSERETQLADVKQRYHRTALDNADLTDTISQLKQELQEARSQVQSVEGELQAACDRRSQAQAALDRECSAHAQTQGLLETARLYLETAKRDGEAQSQEVVRLKEKAAVQEAQCLDAAKALEAAQAKLGAADERMQLIGEQMEQERARHAQSLAVQEEHLVAQAEHALATVQQEKATLQGALEQTNRQLQQAYRDVETLRLQLDHMRLAPPPPSGAPAAAGPSPRQTSSHPLRLSTEHGDPAGRAGYGRQLPQHGSRPSDLLNGHAYRQAPSGSSREAAAGLRQEHVGTGRYPDGLQDSFEADAASSVSGDVFSDVGDGADNSRVFEQQHGTSRFAPSVAAAASRGQHGGGGTAADLYQQQLHQHIDSLTTKLSSFERAVERARHAGIEAASQGVRSSEELPQSLQRRQAEVTEGAMKAKLASERQNFLKERQRLDEQLLEKERLLQEREEELQRLQKEREGAALSQREEELQQKEIELRQLAQHLQEQQRQHASAPASMAGTVPPSPAQLLHHEAPGQRWLPPAASAPVSHAGTAPASPAAPLHCAASTTYYRHQPQGPASHQPAHHAAMPSMGAVAAPTAGSSHLQHLRASAQLPVGGGSLRQPVIGGLRHSMVALRASAQGAQAPPPGTSGLRDSTAMAQPGPASWGAQGPLQRLALGTGPRQSADSVHTPRGMGTGGQPYSAAQPAALGARLGLSAQSSPAGVAPTAAGGRGGGLGAAAAGGAGDTEDPLAKARRQVIMAKDYLRQVAEMGGKLSRGATD